MSKERFEKWVQPVLEHGKLSHWNWMVHHPDNIKLGNKVDIGAFTYINALAGIEIGDRVEIGSHCSIYSVSTIDDKIGRVVLEEGCKVGSHSTVMPGVTIGRNAVIGAHSFVNKNIPANSVAFGVPARVRKSKK